jgi:hypothetical protein
MSDSVEDTFVAAVGESLQAISPADGYHTQLPLAMSSADPLVKPLPGAAPLVRVSCESGQSGRIVFAVAFWVVGSGRGDSVRQALNLVSDIKRRLLDEDPTLGGKVLSVDEIAADEPEMDPIARNDGSARLSFEARVLPPETDEKEQQA